MEYKHFVVFDGVTIELYTCTNSWDKIFQSSTDS